MILGIFDEVLPRISIHLSNVQPEMSFSFGSVLHLYGPAEWEVAFSNVQGECKHYIL